MNRGPKVAARTFGPATAGVLLLLWVMIIASIWKFGFRLPSFNLSAFRPEYLRFTFGGYARILAVMTGIEVFANLVAAYEGTPSEKSRKAFGSLLIIMGTASATMLFVGPAIFQLSNPANESVSVFTQAMDQLLPFPLPWAGSLVGVVVLLSASAASAQGLQNLALGLKDRNYIPAFIGTRNRFEVADKPVWIEVAIVCFCFLAFGTNEETYLAIYAAGVFIMLSMVGWAATNRLARELREAASGSTALTLVATMIAATLTTGATIIIFGERFLEGTWTYLVLVPVLFAAFTLSRNRLGAPSPALEQLGHLEEAMLGGFGMGQAYAATAGGVRLDLPVPPRLSLREAPGTTKWLDRGIDVFRHILVPLDGSDFAEQALPLAEMLTKSSRAKLTLLSVVPIRSRLEAVSSVLFQTNGSKFGTEERQVYLRQVGAQLSERGLTVATAIETGPIPARINEYVIKHDVDLLVLNTHGRSGIPALMIGSVASAMLQLVPTPVLVTRPGFAGNGREVRLRKILAVLDGTELAESVLPYVSVLSRAEEAEVTLLSVPEVPEVEKYGAPIDEVQELRRVAETQLSEYLEVVSADLREAGLRTRAIVGGSGAARTVVSVSRAEDIDLILLTTYGRGRMERLFRGSVTEQIIKRAACPVFLVPVRQ